ncbi:MAG: hypothetical protein IT201_01940 [Thermoleophilia bacterium]|nr:hypothetical protein [Thermoleophilia bacterium]
MREATCDPLYNAVALGMWAYVRAAFRVQALGAAGFELRRGDLLVATHRAETDVPLICPAVYFAGELWRPSRPWLRFAAREDMFDRGFFAGFPPDLSPRLRRLLYPIRAGAILPCVRVHPLPFPSPDVLRLGRALESVPPSAGLQGLVPEGTLALLRDRAAAVGLPEPVAARDALRGEFADLLWRVYPRSELSAPALEDAWSRRAVATGEQLRDLVALVRAGEPMLFFPEGRPSPDGSIGPLRRGLSLIVRRGRPRRLRAVSIAYDPLTRGRPHALVAFGEPFAPRPGRLDDEVLGALRRALPLTCGQVVASELLAAARDRRDQLDTARLDAALAGEAQRSSAAGRPVDRALLTGDSRRRRLSDALARVADAGLVRVADRRTLVLDRERVELDAAVARLARERESARG